jgi:hypothetical protein
MFQYVSNIYPPVSPVFLRKFLATKRSVSQEGAWLGWQRLESQLDPCSRAGTSSKPHSLPSAWRRFGSALDSLDALDCVRYGPGMAL